MFEDSASARFIGHYGYLAILLGTMLEGETIVLVAGFLAHQGYLSIPLIILFSIIGSTISDQGLFFLSRFKGRQFLQRFPKVYAKVGKLSDKMAAKPVQLTAFALGFRFLYGLRNIAPLFLGMSVLPTMRFVLLNAIGAVLWATTFSLAGYYLAKGINAITGTLARYEIAFVLLLLSGGGAWAFYRHWKAVQAEAVEDGGAAVASTEETKEKAGQSTNDR